MSISGTTSTSQHVQGLTDYLSHNQGVVIGEVHNDRASSQYLMENLETARKCGVKYLFLESLESDIYQEHIDTYQAAPDKPMPPKLANALYFQDIILAGKEKAGLDPSQLKQLQRDMSSSNQSTREAACQAMERLQKYSSTQVHTRTSVVEKASELGIKIILVDSSQLKNLGGAQRLKALNEVGCKIIKQTTINSSDKYISVAGQHHTVEQLGVSGLRSRLRVPLIQVDTNTHNNQRLAANNITSGSGENRYQVDLQVLLPKATDYTAAIEAAPAPSPSPHTDIVVPQENIDFFG
ncbi:MAG: hypothetical protein KFB95_08165 [Simkaniaceae bacterium]|nr:MAG: hypothetical protein KFB95_08165 [Simkaniaceae bacterium]